MKPVNWFEVDVEGLKALFKGKSKKYIINELVANAWDENITFCKIGIVSISDYEIKLYVIDDSPEGFRDITHAYTLFADTYKRRDPTKRGRFNLGEKFVIAICNSAKVTTTKGTVCFDQRGRTEEIDCTKVGTVIEIFFPGTPKECAELIEHAKKILVPPGVKYYVNDELIPYTSPHKSFEAKLYTEILEDNQVIRTKRKTTINLIKHNDTEQSYIHEMGIPIAKIECPWHVDIQQKILLGVDRETVKPLYLQDLYAEILNHTYEEITEDQASDLWVRTALKDERITKEAVDAMLHKRYGDKFLVRNPMDGIANDDALSHGYDLISGREMSKEEWDQIKKYELMQSTTEVFGTSGLAEEDPVTPDSSERAFKNLAKKIADEYFNIKLTVRFVRSTVNALAYYEQAKHEVTFNLKRLPKDFFLSITKENLGLLIHELSHEWGHHTEKDYHMCLTNLGGWLVMKALEDPDFFREGEN